MAEPSKADGILPRSDLSVSMPKGAAMPRTEPSKEALEAAKCCLGKDRPETPLTHLIATALDAFAAAAVRKARNAALEEVARLVDHHPFAEGAAEECADAQGCCEAMAAQIRDLKS